MYLAFQQTALEQLASLAKSDVHSILISGISGSGKTFLAKQFAKQKNIHTFNTVEPKVQDLKDSLDSSYKLDDKHVMCIENLEQGKDAAAQVILKYLEEPMPNVYIVITCVNASKLPDTIVSRSIDVKLEPPSQKDIFAYGEYVNSTKLDILKTMDIVSTCKSLYDMKELLDMKLDSLKYYESLLTDKLWSKSIDQIMWDLGHFEDNSPTDLKLVMRIIYRKSLSNTIVRDAALNALLGLEFGRLSTTAVLGKFVLDVKLTKGVK